MMFCGVHVFFLWSFVISATSQQRQPKKRPGSDTGRDVDSAGSGSELGAILCSEAGNCTCFFEELRVTVKCTSAGDKLDKIAFELPETTTHL